MTYLILWADKLQCTQNLVAVFFARVYRLIHKPTALQTRQSVKSLILYRALALQTLKLKTLKLLYLPIFLMAFLQQTAHAEETGKTTAQLSAATANSLGDMFVAMESPVPESDNASQSGQNGLNRLGASQVGSVRSVLLEDARMRWSTDLTGNENSGNENSGNENPHMPAVTPLISVSNLMPAETATSESSSQTSIVYTGNTHATALRYMPLANDASDKANRSYQGALYVAANQPDQKSAETNGSENVASLTNLHRLALKKTNGQWQLDEEHSAELDLSPIDGLFNATGLLTSHWETLLAVEAMPLQATDFWNAPALTLTNAMPMQIRASAVSVNDYLKRDSNPYRYGYVVELVDQPLKNDGKNELEVLRHYATGRMPAGKTLLSADSRTLYRVAEDAGILFRFVSDFPNNLAAGTLSVGRFVPIQTQNENPYVFSSFNLEWIELGRGNNEEIAGWIADYEGMTTYDFSEGQTSYLSNDDVAAWFGKHKRRHLSDTGDINQYIDSRVAFLEPVKAAAAIGADRQAVKIRDITLSGNHLVMRVAADSIDECGEFYAGAPDIEGSIKYISRIPVDAQAPELCSSEFVLSANEQFLPSPGVAYVNDGSTISRIQLPLLDN